MLSRPIDQQMTAEKLQCEEEKICPYPTHHHWCPWMDQSAFFERDGSISELSLYALFRDLSCAE
jgi:hypothetical protein